MLFRISTIVTIALPTMRLIISTFFAFLFFNATSAELVQKVVITETDTTKLSFVSTPALYTEGWDTCTHPLFWQNVMQLSGDTCIVNIAKQRKPLLNIPKNSWMGLRESLKDSIKDSICLMYGLDTATQLFITAGKKEFYQIRKVLPDIGEAVMHFNKYQVDAWYAQAILLIESPGKKKATSYVGARGPFQLMRSVATRFGLKVNKNIDERTQMDKAAKAAAGLIGTICIPELKKILDTRGIAYMETDLWFRLLVLHVYHAGAGNVGCALRSIDSTITGPELIKTLWRTECGSFKNESQNYSQLALATQLLFSKLINTQSDTIWQIAGNRSLQLFKAHHKTINDSTFSQLNAVRMAYENDLIDGVINAPYMMEKVKSLKPFYKKLAAVAGYESLPLTDFPANELYVDSLASLLLKQFRFDDAIVLLKYNESNNPSSVQVNERLSYAYSLKGDKLFAVLYNNKAQSLKADVKGEPSTN